MKLNDIEKELNGYFIYRESHQRELALKQGENYELITKEIPFYQMNFKETYLLKPLEYLRMQINSNILDPTTFVKNVDEVLPIVDFNIFHRYDKRADEIKQHKALIEKIQGSKSIFGKRKDYKLIFVAGSGLSEDKYFVVKESDVVPVDVALIDDKTDAVEVENISEVKRALQDTFENEYSEKYKQEVEKWNSI